MSLGSGFGTLSWGYQSLFNAGEQAAMNQRDELDRREKLNQAHERLMQSRDRLEAEQMRAYAQKVNAENRLEQTRFKAAREENRHDEHMRQLEGNASNVDSAITKYVSPIEMQIDKLYQRLLDIERKFDGQLLQLGSRVENIERSNFNGGDRSPNYGNMPGTIFGSGNNVSYDLSNTGMRSKKVIAPSTVTDLAPNTPANVDEYGFAIPTATLKKRIRTNGF